MTGASKCAERTRLHGFDPTGVSGNRRDLNVNPRRAQLTGSLRYRLFVRLATIAGSTDENRESSKVNTPTNVPHFNNVHVHLTNDVQQGITARHYFEIVGVHPGRVAMFGYLQQKGDCFVSVERAPNDYLLSDVTL